MLMYHIYRNSNNHYVDIVESYKRLKKYFENKKEKIRKEKK